MDIDWHKQAALAAQYVWDATSVDQRRVLWLGRSNLGALAMAHKLAVVECKRWTLEPHGAEQNPSHNFVADVTKALFLRALNARPAMVAFDER